MALALHNKNKRQLADELDLNNEVYQKLTKNKQHSYDLKRFINDLTDDTLQFSNNSEIEIKYRQDELIKDGYVVQLHCQKGIEPRDTLAPNPGTISFGNTNAHLRNHVEIFRGLRENYISDEVLKDECLKLVHKTTIYKVECGVGEYKVFEGRIKGGARYANEQKQRILEKAKEMMSLGGETVALTLTCDPKKYHNNCLNAWQYWTKDSHKMLENMRKNWGMKYIGVLESTSKLYPHKHLILSFPKGTIPGYNKMRDRTKMFFGKPITELKKRCGGQIFHLEIIKGDRTAKYLVKYIAKVTSFNLKKIAEKKEPLTDEERKALFTIFITKCLHLRQFSCSLNRKKKHLANIEKVGDNPSTEDALQSAKDFSNCNKNADEVRVTATACRRFLDYICTNSLFGCAKCFKTIRGSQYFEQFDSYIKENDEQKQEKLDFIDHYGKDFGCKGCYLSEITSFVTTKKSIMFNPLMYNCSYKNKLFNFEEEDFNDDVKYINKFTAILRHVFYYMRNENKDLGTALNELIDFASDVNIYNYRLINK